MFCSLSLPECRGEKIFLLLIILAVIFFLFLHWCAGLVNWVLDKDYRLRREIQEYITPKLKKKARYMSLLLSFS